ncbi:MAG: hypothetical protein Q4D61_00975 [Cardiobacteriaceae bacterium]|nr:hypothetical protein [Cardiobacteriaceae bacterium]
MRRKIIAILTGITCIAVPTFAKENTHMQDSRENDILANTMSEHDISQHIFAHVDTDAFAPLDTVEMQETRGSRLEQSPGGFGPIGNMSGGMGEFSYRTFGKGMLQSATTGAAVHQGIHMYQYGVPATPASTAYAAAMSTVAAARGVAVATAAGLKGFNKAAMAGHGLTVGFFLNTINPFVDRSQPRRIPSPDNRSFTYYHLDTPIPVYQKGEGWDLPVHMQPDHESPGSRRD